VPPRAGFRVPCDQAIKKRLGRLEFPRACLYEAEGRWRVRLTGSQGSGILRSMTEANCFICLPEDCSGVDAGDLVEVQPFAGIL
jgi:molybdopterin molybdotransferase